MIYEKEQSDSVVQAQIKPKTEPLAECKSSHNRLC